MSSEDVFKASSRRLGQDQCIRLGYTSARCLQDVFKASSRRLVKVLIKTNIFALAKRLVFKTFSRRLQDVFKKSCKNVFETSSRRLQKRKTKTIELR